MPLTGIELRSLRLVGALALASCVHLSCTNVVDDREPESSGLSVLVPSSQFTTDPVAGVGHRALFDLHGKIVEPNRSFVVDVQAFYLTRLYGEATDDVKSMFLRAFAADAKNPRTDDALVRANAKHIDWLIASVKPSDAARLMSINMFLKNTAPGGSDEDEWIGVTEQAYTTNNELKGQAYIDACLAAGVPTPPGWNEHWYDWSYRGYQNVNLLAPNTFAEVYIRGSSTPFGVCIMLARSTPSFPTNSIGAVGIICQGRDTSKACFWDLPDNLMPIAPGATIPLTSFLGGADLVNNAGNGGVCSDCHAGENAFIIHPGTPLDIGDANVRAKSWVNPMLSIVWPQNRRPGHDLDTVTPPPGEASCVAVCHNKSNGKRFPKLTNTLFSYWNVVAQGAFQQTMPPGAPGDPAYSTHRAVFEAAVTTPPDPVPNKFGLSLLYNTAFPTGVTTAVGDFNNDGRTDLVAFTMAAGNDVFVETSYSWGFYDPVKWNDDFGAAGEIPRVGDINGDGRDDVLMFNLSSHKVFVATSSGATFTKAAQPWNSNFGSVGEVPMTGDFNNDGKDDIVAFTKGTTGRVWVSLSTGSGFGTATTWLTSGFSLGSEVPEVGDFNGDGFDDIVTFKKGVNSEVWVALNTGASSFAAPTRWHTSFAAGTEVPRVGDVNGDGFDDIVGFGADGKVWTAVAKAWQPIVNGFDTRRKWHDNFLGQPGFVGDVQADGRWDAIAISGGSTVWVAEATPW